MANTSIHRVIEAHAAARGGDVAIADGPRTLTYRSLNLIANVVARRLMACGFRRGSHAWVRMPYGADLVCVLLAILKAGGSYTWIEPGSRLPHPEGVSIETRTSSTEENTEETYRHVGCAALLAGAAQSASPNLPVLTRGSDIACVLRDGEGAPLVLVPHDALAGQPGALALWTPLIAGAAVAMQPPAAEPAAA